MKVLYLAPLVPSISGNGGKRAIFNHLEDLAQTTTDVDLIAVDIEGSGEALPHALFGFRGHVFPRAMPSGRSIRGMIAGLLQLLCDAQPRAVAVVASKQARQAVRRALRESRYDVVVVDHLNAAGLLRDFVTSTPIQYIAHNVEADVLRDQRALHGKSFLQTLRLSLELAKMNRFEAALLERANVVTAIARTDGESPALRAVSEKTTIWPELPDIRVRYWRAPATRRILFVGSAAYFPNRDAIEWLLSQLMPAMARIAPDVVLHIAGTSASQLNQAQPTPNIKFEGFVSAERLDELHRVSDLFICPVILGSGIKIKVLEATGYGLPIAATRESLAGIEYLAGAALLIDRDGESSALQIAATLADPGSLNAISARASTALESARAIRAPLVSIPSSRQTASLCDI